MVRTGMLRCWYIWCCYVVVVLWWVLVLWGACLLGYLYGGVRIYGDGLFACWCWYGGLLALIRWCVGMVRCWHGEVLYMV